MLEKKQATFDHALFDAIASNDREMMDWALTRGANVLFTRGGTERHTALMVAAMNRREDLVDPLVEAKADPRASDAVSAFPDPFEILIPSSAELANRNALGRFPGRRRGCAAPRGVSWLPRR